MFWVLKSASGKIMFSFQSSTKEVLKRMHRAKADFKEEFYLYGRHFKGSQLIKIVSTLTYPEMILYGKKVCTTCNNQGNGN